MHADLQGYRVGPAWVQVSDTVGYGYCVRIHGACAIRLFSGEVYGVCELHVRCVCVCVCVQPSWAAVDILLVIAAGVEAFVAVFAAALACRSICSGRLNTAPVRNPPSLCCVRA